MRTIGKYQILGLLGRGGMGAVYKARHVELGFVAALKVLEPAEIMEAVVGMPELERRFTLEARTMAGIRHENITPVWEFGRDEAGRLYFVLEYCCNNVGAVIGETYEVEAPSRVLRVDRAADIAMQALEGLSRLHFAGIVHRDVKPFNLLLTNSGTVRLIDFGLSKLRGEQLAFHGAEQVGSPYYAAPEQEKDPEAADERSDIFAVGVMLQRMVTGRLPQLSDAAPSTMNPDLDAGWDDFFADATAKNPARRPASASEMRGQLEQLMTSWREKIGGVCTLPDEEFEISAPMSKEKPRSTPIKTGPKAGPDAFRLDALWRPVQYVDGGVLSSESGFVDDAVSGLRWEAAGSAYPLDWDEAHEYVRTLNEKRAGGREGWRLPTVDEIRTLLRPVAQGRDFCVEPAFDSRQNRLWTADLRTFASAWSADAELGFITSSDMTCRLYVRAVSG